MFIIAIVLLLACEKNTRHFLFGVPTTAEKLTRSWMISRAILEGNDVTFNYDRYLLNFRPDGEVNLQAKFNSKRSFLEYKTIGSWFLLNHQKKLLLDFENNEADAIYQILKIKEDEIWLKKEGEPLELHFVEQ